MIKFGAYETIRELARKKAAGGKPQFLGAAAGEVAAKNRSAAIGTIMRRWKIS